MPPKPPKPVPEPDDPVIRSVALECAREALADTPPAAELVRDVAPECFERLARRLDRPCTDAERSAFRVAFEHALAELGQEETD